PNGDNHDLWMDSANPARMIESNDGGAGVSVNGGETWTGQEYPTAQLYHVATTRDIPYHVCGAQQDNSTICVSSAAGGRGGRGGTAPYAVGGGESGYIAPHPTNPQHLWRTVDDGHSWQVISPDLTRGDPKTLGDSGGPITHDQNGPEIYGTIFTIAPSRKEKDTIWTGSDDGLVYITRDAGKHWTKITPPGTPDFGRVSLIDASTHNPGGAYVA